MGVKVANNAFGQLNAGITSGDTVIVLQSGQGAKFPTLGSGDYFYATLIDTGNNLEIIKVTARSVDTLTAVRGQDGTTARAYSAGDRLELRPTAAMFEDFTQASSIGYDNTTSGIPANNVQTAIDQTQTTLGGKQDTLVSGSNIKTVNGSTVLGSGDLLLEKFVRTEYTSPAVYDPPAGLKQIKVIVVGGGGGGGGARSNPPGTWRYGGGGAGGGTGIIYIPAPSIPGPVTVTVGAGGAGGPAPTSNNTITAGVTGGTSSFGSFISATGGQGAITATPPTPLVATGGVASGDFNFMFGDPSGRTGTPGQNRLNPVTIQPELARGGSAHKGTEYNGPNENTKATRAGIPGAPFGAGGNGGIGGPGNNNPNPGGNGADGIVIIEEFY
jgi:hypothetical protein